MYKKKGLGIVRHIKSHSYLSISNFQNQKFIYLIQFQRNHSLILKNATSAVKKDVRIYCPIEMQARIYFY